MKKIILLFGIFFQACVSHCLNKYDGQVVDSETNLPIANVGIVLLANDEFYINLPSKDVLLTDSLGKFNLKIHTGECWENVKLIFAKSGYSTEMPPILEKNIATVKISMKKIKD